MLGLGDFSVALAYILTICSVILCVVWGILNWNKGGEVTPEGAAMEKTWDEEEKEIDEEMPGGDA